MAMDGGKFECQPKCSAIAPQMPDSRKEDVPRHATQIFFKFEAARMTNEGAFETDGSVVKKLNARVSAMFFWHLQNQRVLRHPLNFQALERRPPSSVPFKFRDDGVEDEAGVDR